MAIPHYTFKLVATPVAGAVEAGFAMVKTSDGYVTSTTAARGTTRSSGLALGPAGVNNNTIMQNSGDVDSDLSQLGAGTAGPIRVSASGLLERCTPVSGDDVVGWVETDGTAHVCFGVLPWDAFATAAVSLALSGDVTGTTDDNVVRSIQGVPVDTDGEIFAGEVLKLVSVDGVLTGKLDRLDLSTDPTGLLDSDLGGTGLANTDLAGNTGKTLVVNGSHDGYDLVDLPDGGAGQGYVFGGVSGTVLTPTTTGGGEANVAVMTYPIGLDAITGGRDGRVLTVEFTEGGYIKDASNVTGGEAGNTTDLVRSPDGEDMYLDDGEAITLFWRPDSDGGTDGAWRVLATTAASGAAAAGSTGEPQINDSGALGVPGGIVMGPSHIDIGSTTATSGLVRVPYNTGDILSTRDSGGADRFLINQGGNSITWGNGSSLNSTMTSANTTTVLGGGGTNLSVANVTRVGVNGTSVGFALPIGGLSAPIRLLPTTLTFANADITLSSSQSQCPILICAGTSGDIIVTSPPVGSVFIVDNTTPASNRNIKTSSTTGISCQTGYRTAVYWDGAAFKKLYTTTGT